MDELLNAYELKVVDLLGEAWNGFIQLEVLHEDDMAEFKAAIHKAQNVVMSRPVLRQLNQRKKE